MFGRLFHRKTEEEGEEEVDSDLYLIRPHPSCPNGHLTLTLQKEGLGSKGSCLLCYLPTKEKETYGCEECRWHICKPCYSKLLRWNHLGLGGGYYSDQSFPKCSYKHWLVNYRMGYPRRCNECHKSIVKGESYYACTCSRLCLQCHDLKLMEAGALWSDMGHEIRLMRCGVHTTTRMVISQLIYGTRCGKCQRSFRGRDTILACSNYDCRYFLCVACFTLERTRAAEEEEEEDDFPDSLAIDDLVRNEESSNLENDDHYQVESTAHMMTHRNESSLIEEEEEGEAARNDNDESNNESASIRRNFHSSNSNDDDDDVMDIFNRLEASRYDEEYSSTIVGNRHERIQDIERIFDSYDSFGLDGNNAVTSSSARNQSSEDDATIPNSNSELVSAGNDSNTNNNNDRDSSSNNDHGDRSIDDEDDEESTAAIDTIIEMQNRILASARNVFLRQNNNQSLPSPEYMAPPSHPPPPVPRNTTAVLAPPSHPPPSSTTTTTRRVTFATTSTSGTTGPSPSSAKSSRREDDESLVEVDASTPAIFECTICSTYVKNRVLGCGHTLCSLCANTLKSSTKKCPFCNSPIQTVIPFYM